MAAILIEADTGSVRTSSTSDTVIRGRTWSRDITANWNSPPLSVDESISQRLERYEVYFTLTKDQMTHIMTRFVEEIDLGLSLKKSNPDVQWTAERCSLRLLDTCVNDVPTGQEIATTYAIDLGGTNLRAVRADLLGNGKIVVKNKKRELKSCAPHLKKGLLDKEASASEFFDAFVTPLSELMGTDASNKTSKNTWSSVGFTFSFPIEQKTIKNAVLATWTKEFETGRATQDPVEGNDVCALLDQALWRNEVTAKVAAVMNDTTGTLLSCAYERPPKTPPCLIGFIVGTGVNGCYYQEDANEFGYRGRIINTECGGFNKGLPINDVDLEVDYANLPNRHQQLFEKMTSGMYLGEVCRRFVIKVFQNAAPELAWARESFPSEVASLVLNDSTPELSLTRQVLDGIWEWQASDVECQQVKRIVTLVFDRSAALVATVIAGMAKKTGRLQLALGGLTVGVDGSLFTQNKWYADRMAVHLTTVLGDDVAKLIHLRESNDGSGKGAAVLAAVVGKK